MERIAKMDYEIDPNSPFNKLKKLQVSLKQETSLLDIFYDEKEELIKKINEDCYKYYKNNIEIMEIYDKMNKNKIIELNNDEKMEMRKYEIVKNSHIELSQCYEIVHKFLFSIRNDYSIILKIIEKIDILEFDQFANFFCNFFFTNILSTDDYEESLLVFILFLLKKEIGELKSTTSKFLCYEKSFTSYVLKYFLRKIEIKIFFEDICKEIETRIKEVNKEFGIFIGFELNNIKNYLQQIKMNKLRRIIKTTDPKLLLFKEIPKSKLFNYEKEILNNEKENEENEKSLYFELKDYIDIYKFKDKTIKNDTIKDIEQYFINSGVYEFNGYIKKEINEENINNNYQDFFDKEWLILYTKNVKNNDIQQFLIKQIISIQLDNNIYTSLRLFEEISKMKEKQDMNDKIILFYKYQFEKIKNLIDVILISIINNIHLIPYNIKCICSMIDKLITKKFPKISLIEKNKFIGNFFFRILLYTILKEPNFNGIIQNIGSKDEIEIAIIVINKLYKGIFFNSSKKNEQYYTIFNHYFLEIESFICKIFENLIKVELPNSIEKLIEKIDFINNTTITYDYIEFRPEERVDYQSICFTWDILILIYSIIKENEKEFGIEDNNIFHKSFNKLIFQEKIMNKKLDADIKHKKKTFICITEPIFDKNLSEIMKMKKIKKFSFQTDESLTQLNNEKFTLERIKYCINILVKNLNTLTRENYFIEKGKKDEDFALTLNKMLELEGFSDMLKEQTIPLRWFGLYLQSNISNIPIEYKRQNYILLLNELIDSSKKNITNHILEDSLNFLYIKYNFSQKIISFSEKYLDKIKINQTYHMIFKFIYYKSINVFIIEIVNNKKEIIKYVIKTELSEEDKVFNIFNCENINQFISYFPNIIELRDIDNFFIYEKKVNIPNLLIEYLNIIFQNLSSDIFFKEKEKYNLAKREITNYIFEGIYHKLYNPDQPSTEDLKIFQNSFKYDWVKPENIIENYNSINDEMISLAINFITQINNEKSPINKLNCLEKVEEIINNIQIIYGYKDNFNSILLYLLIKAHPNFFNSDWAFINLYIPNSYNHGKMNNIISNVKKVINQLLNLSFDKLYKISEEEYKTKMILE